jgi:hypothetical protein
MHANFGQSESMIRALSASVLCSDGTSDVDNGFVPPCSGHGGEAEIMDEESTPSNDVVDVESEMFPDELSAISEDENPCAGVRCIRLYKPCPEGFMDADPCCPNTGDCVPDPMFEYQEEVPAESRYDKFVTTTTPPECPTGYTAKVQDCMSGCFWMCVDSSGRSPDAPRDTPLPTERVQADYSRVPLNPVSFEAPSTPATETSTTEEPKQGGLGILAIGLIALKVLAT